MNQISVNDIQQQGIAALSEALKMGPIQIVEPNHPVYVVLTETEYINLTKRPAKKTSVLDLFTQPGTRSREDIDAAFRAEREAWDKK
jgi:intein/homing endonuclease